jgi:hypothetical protein
MSQTSPAPQKNRRTKLRLQEGGLVVVVIVLGLLLSIFGGSVRIYQRSVQERVFAYLTDPATHPLVRRIDTHAASVFLEGDRARDRAVVEENSDGFTGW